MFQPYKMLKDLVWKLRMNLLRHFLLAAPRGGGGSKNISVQQLWWIWFWGSPSWKKLAHDILCYMWKKHNEKNYAIRLRTVTESEIHVHKCVVSQECILWCSKCFQRKAQKQFLTSVLRLSCSSLQSPSMLNTREE